MSTRRGRRLVAPAPTGDPWGYYAECRELHRMEVDRTIPETSAQPCTELSTETMDTNEGQRTTARLLEEARCLSTAAMEPFYATIDESMSATLQGSEAAISDILATQDPRELHKSEAGEKGPTPVEMKAGLPAGSFSPFNFEKEFQMRHGVSPEDADKPWQSFHQFRASPARSQTPDLEMGSVNTEVSPSTSPTRDKDSKNPWSGKRPRIYRKRDVCGKYTSL